MKIKRLSFPLLLMVVTLVFPGCKSYKDNQEIESFDTENIEIESIEIEEDESETIELSNLKIEDIKGSNPASLYCENNGGTLTLEEWVWICTFEDWSNCEQWAYYRDKCKPGYAIVSNEDTTEINTYTETDSDIKENLNNVEVTNNIYEENIKVNEVTKITSSTQQKPDYSETNDNKVESQKVLICTLNATPSVWTQINSVYKIYHDGKYVSLLDTVETVKSNDKQVLDYYKLVTEESYKPFKNIEYYDYDIKLANNILTSKVSINYAKINIDKVMDIDPEISILVKDGKISLDLVELVYELMGASCE